ncbi:di-heme oxidoredictase family protein [Xanthovirga aplysinae]|uniref:di-heme oxidoredictase family protein n=1 Tax=Xanthovirga aplysinae TaxID=2529853 RepID=UPI001656C0A2|nr:di-heme oxidoredictase family protein [Xanthovirga aplysinae]
MLNRDLLNLFKDFSPPETEGFKKGSNWRGLYYISCIFSFFLLLSTSNYLKAQSMGIDYVDDNTGIVWFDASNATANWSYVCLNGCYTGTKNGNRIERQFSGLTLGVSYEISAQIQDDDLGQILPSGTVVFTSGGQAPTCEDGIQNGDETGVDCGGSCDPCIPDGGEGPIVQAETGTLLGNASFYSDEEATGGQGVAYISSLGAGFQLANVPAASNIDIKYASEFSGDISIFVNGQDVGNVNFSSTGAWVGSYQTVNFITSISEGATFEIIFQDGDVAMNVDEITFNSGNSNPDPTCSDGIQNKGEEGIDCGGPCPGCPPQTYTLTVNEGSGDGNYEENEVITITWEPPSVEPGTALEFAEWTGDVAFLSDPNANPTTVTMPGQDVTISANYEILYSCSDGVQNGNETGIDCGGDCSPCGVDPVVNTITVSGNVVLVGGDGSPRPGFTLYTFDNDNGGPFSTCEDGCADTWPPLLVPGVNEVIIPDLSAAFDGTFGVSGRCDGTYQLTYNNEPLYFYSGDGSVGDTNGDGGLWHIISSPNGNPTEPGEGQCEGYGLSYTGGNQAILYSHESLGAPCYMCTGPGFGGCSTNFYYEDGFYKMNVSVTPGEPYSFGIQCGPNVLVEGIVGEGENCWFTPSCNDGFQNGEETEVDCGGPECDPCPTCDDGIQNGDETGVDCGGSNCSGNNADCATVCNGTPNPYATFSSTGESFDGNNDGSITFTFSNVSDRTGLDFSLDGGITFPYSTLDDASTFTISNLSPDSYSLWVRWDGGDCPIFLGDLTISPGQPQPTCNDGILNQGEERVDCGGPCADCEPDNCGSIPLVVYPKPALPTAVIGADPGQGFAIDLSEDLTSVEIRTGNIPAIQSGGDPEFEFFCSCNQVEFYSTPVESAMTEVPSPCVNAGDYYYFVRYRKLGNTTDDPGDIYVYSALFTTTGPRIDPDNRSPLVTLGANWMRFRHPHSQDGITEAVFDAFHNGDQLRYLDRFSTTFTDASTGLTIDPRLTSNIGGYHPHGDVNNTTPLRIEYMEIGDTSPPRYALAANKDAGKWGWGNIITYEITAVTGGSGAQTYNTFQNYVIGEGLNTFGDPRNASAGRATTNMVLPGFGEAKDIEHDAIFTQHIITLTTEEQVDDFLEGHHLFHAAPHRGTDFFPDKIEPPFNLPAYFIGENACGNCHFRDGRGSEVIQTPRGPRIPPPVFGTGLLEWIAGREAGFRWDGGANTVREQTRNALVEDHLIDPDNPEHISQEDLDKLVNYVEFLSVPARSYAAHDDGVVQSGNVLFLEVGCGGCHAPTQKTRSDAPEMFRNIVLRPYTDMKKHTVTDAPYRTPALWGLGRNIKLLNDNGRQLLLMHDGRASTLEEAIQAHGGEAQGSTDAYNQLSGEEQQAIIRFLESL